MTKVNLLCYINRCKDHTLNMLTRSGHPNGTCSIRPTVLAELTSAADTSLPIGKSAQRIPPLKIINSGVNQRSIIYDFLSAVCSNHDTVYVRYVAPFSRYHHLWSRAVLQVGSYKWLSYRRETALQGGLVMAKTGRMELGDNIYGHYNSIFNHCDVFGQQSNRIRWTQKGLLRRSRSFKVIEVGTNRKNAYAIFY